MLHAHDLRRGAAYMVASALLFAAMGVAVKIASTTLPETVVVFFRSSVGLLTLLPLIVGVDLRTRHPREHLVRSLAGMASMYCFFYTLAHMRLAESVLLNYSLPLFMPVVESVWLGEPFPRRLWTPIVVGFFGIVLILRPGSGLVEPVALVGVASALFAAVAQVGVRRLTRTEPVPRIVFYFAVTATLISAVPLPATWRTPAGPEAWWAVIACGVAATFAQLAMTRAYAHAPAAQVGPFIYSSVVFAGLLDWVFWRRLPDAFTVAGGLLVAGAGILSLRLNPSRAEVETPGPATV
ncbi:MAG TPA: DMT family transporter [Vicinamibacteria bacterium]|nr:DMT family transporter [Vicinamibacteria bacterium]